MKMKYEFIVCVIDVMLSCGGLNQFDKFVIIAMVQSVQSALSPQSWFSIRDDILARSVPSSSTIGAKTFGDVKVAFCIIRCYSMVSIKDCFSCRALFQEL